MVVGYWGFLMLRCGRCVGWCVYTYIFTPRHVWRSRVTYGWVMSHWDESCPIWMCHVASFYHLSLSRVEESCHVWMSHVAYAWVMSHMNESSHIWMSHVTYGWAMSSMCIYMWFKGVLLWQYSNSTCIYMLNWSIVTTVLQNTCWIGVFSQQYSKIHVELEYCHNNSTKIPLNWSIFTTILRCDNTPIQRNFCGNPQWSKWILIYEKIRRRD